MAIFKGDAIKRVNKLLDKGEARRTKLQEKIETLQEEVNFLYQAVQDDFNEAILEDKEPNKKLSSDLEKAREELAQAQFQQSQIDAVIQSEMDKQKEAIDKERRDFVADKGEEFRELFDEINELKMVYLNKLIEYRNKHREYEFEYRGTFKDVSERLGLRMGDPREHHSININQRYQLDGRYYSPLVYMDEIREAFVDGKISFTTLKNKDAFKQ
ncbi:hypothetical protein [Bacillus subtilis]|uniref:hypothetical protein n=1 Tax=Bacillus subtilis TaxID=1423 RepID=UPI002675859F|nr:hypothetical protein [Bacillus subtilis]MDO3653547.1 hypothetical protein [Bacillus subtilis]